MGAVNDHIKSAIQGGGAVNDELVRFFAGHFLRIKESDQTVNNSATLVDDAALEFEAEANSVYYVEATLRYSTNATADLKVGWSVPASTTMEWGRGHIGSGSSADGFVSAGAGGSGGHVTQADTLDFAGAAENLMTQPAGFIVTAGTAGTVTLRWAQQTANASDTKVLKGSFLFARKVA